MAFCRILATGVRSLSWGDSSSRPCARTMADVGEVSRAIGALSRIGNKFLHIPIGFFGYCFWLDIPHLVYNCGLIGLVAQYWWKVVAKDECQKKLFTGRITYALLNAVSMKWLALSSFAVMQVNVAIGRKLLNTFMRFFGYCVQLDILFRASVHELVDMVAQHWQKVVAYTDCQKLCFTICVNEFFSLVRKVEHDVRRLRRTRLVRRYIHAPSAPWPQDLDALEFTEG